MQPNINRLTFFSLIAVVTLPFAIYSFDPLFCLKIVFSPESGCRLYNKKICLNKSL